MKKLTSITLAVAIIATMFAGLSMTASADQLEQGLYSFVCVEGGRYLNVYAGWDWDGVNVCVWDGDGSNEQKFKMVDRGGNRYVLYPKSSGGRVLDTNRGNSYWNPLQAGNNVDIWQTNDAPAQEWYIDDQGGGKYRISLVSNYNLVLTCDNPWSNGGNVSIQNYTGANNQLWYLKRLDGGNSSLESRVGQRLADFNNAAYTWENPFYNSGWTGQCTWYCWGRAREKKGIWLNTLNNADTWLDRLNINGAWASWWPENGARPCKDSIAVERWPNCHVMYIEDVVGDTVYYTEANTSGAASQWSGYVASDGILRKTTVAQMNSRCKGYIILN